MIFYALGFDAITDGSFSVNVRSVFGDFLFFGGNFEEHLRVFRRFWEVGLALFRFE